MSMDEQGNPDSVVRTWLARLTWKQQTVLLSALRGCDGTPKEDISKVLTRALRRVILRQANVENAPGSFMHVADWGVLHDTLMKFVRNSDHYPTHWLDHFAHAAQIVGIYCPDRETKMFWANVYVEIVRARHYEIEDRGSHEERLVDNAREPVLP